MKKISVVLAALLATNIYASSLYIGVGAESGSGTQDWDTYSTYDYDTSSFSLKFGSINYNNNRLEISFNSMNIDYDSFNDDTYTGLELNYYWTFSRNPSTFNPYIGLGIGYYESSDMTGYNINTGDTENAHAGTFIGSAGVLIGLDKSFEIDLGVKYRYFSWNYVDYDVSDTMTTVYGGLNFKF